MPISSVNPATGEVLATYDSLTEKQLQDKLNRAAEAFHEYRHTTFSDRAEKMNRAAEILENEKRNFARTMTLEMGKSINAAVQEAEKCAWICRYYAENAERHLADEIVETSATKSFVRYRPLGMVPPVIPGNFPSCHVFRFPPPALLAA